MYSDIRTDVLEIINGAIKSVLPENAVAKTLTELKFDCKNIILIAIGKAAWRMAKAAKDFLDGKIKKGIVVTKYGHSLGPIDGVEIYEAGHPIPDENTLKATERILKAVENLTESDIVLFLISGGGSALFEKPKGDIKLEQIQKITDQLLKSGADIVEINTVRKHLSDVKGGRFAEKVYPAKVVSLILSDVLGDRLDSIASGPTYPDRTTSDEAINILEKYSVQVEENVLREIASETPKKLENVEFHIIGSVRTVCEKAAEIASNLGYNTMILTTTLDCEAKEAGRFIAAIAREEKNNNLPLKKPCAIVFGGETVVHVTGKGKGGRNQELALSAVKGIAELEEVVICSVGTDGTDGPTDVAGGIVDGESLKRLRKLGIDVDEMLKNNDSYNALKSIDGLIITGPTGTNVNDLILLLVR